MRRRLSLVVAALSCVLAACGGGSSPSSSKDAQPPKTGGPPVLEKPAPKAEQPVQDLGFPGFATKNTTRVGGADPVADAAGVALAVYPSASADTRPPAVLVVDRRDWRAAISAAQLTARPLRAPVLFSAGGSLPAATKSALDTLQPTGARDLRGAQVIRVGDAAATPDGSLKTRAVPGSDFAAIARRVDNLQARLAGRRTRAVIVASADRPAYAMPVAALAAKTGGPVFWTHRDRLPARTAAAIRAHHRGRIYVVGPEAAISDKVFRRLARLGTVRRVSGADPVSNAIALARFSDGSFGWNVVDPGHGLVLASAARPADAAGGAALASAGTFGPLLLTSEPDALPAAVQSFLLDIQPGYDRDPVRGVYNHAWLMGDERAISGPVQARVDALLEIQPVGSSR